MDPIFVTIGLLGLLAFFVVIDIGVGEASQGDLASSEPPTPRQAKQKHVEAQESL